MTASSLSTSVRIEDVLLLGPGPTNPTNRVMAALREPVLGHLDPDFLSLMDRCKTLLRKVFRTPTSLTFPVSGTGGSGMDLLLVNLVEAEDKIVIAVNGFFGGRLAQLSQILGANTVRVEAPWGQPVDKDELLAAVDRHRPKLVCIVNGETSTGVYQDMSGIADAVHETGGLLLMDCVTSLATMPVEVEQWGVDVAFSCSQKGLGCPSGLSPVTIGRRALEFLDRRLTPVPSFYLNLAEVQKYIDGVDGRRLYHHTASSTLYYALLESLEEILEEGLEARWARHEKAARYLIKEVSALGLEPLVAEPDRLHALTTLIVPERLDEARIRSRLRSEHRIEVGAGLGDLAGKVWRVGLMGQNADRAVVDRFVEALRAVL